jgi:plasmid stabilization system protein ParE
VANDLPGMQEITAAFRLLASNPEAGHLRQDLTTLPVKFWSVFSYLIVYDPAASPIAIVRVIDGRRDVRAILDREGQGGLKPNGSAQGAAR